MLYKSGRPSATFRVQAFSSLFSSLSRCFIPLRLLAPLHALPRPPDASLLCECFGQTVDGVYPIEPLKAKQGEAAKSKARVKDVRHVTRPVRKAAAVGVLQGANGQQACPTSYGLGTPGALVSRG